MTFTKTTAKAIKQEMLYRVLENPADFVALDMLNHIFNHAEEFMMTREDRALLATFITNAENENEVRGNHRNDEEVE
jgi:hypothetical protein